MRGIRIWHLAALALTVPLLAANVPSGCTGLMNPNFVAGVMGQDAAGASVAAENGFIVLGFFNYTGWPGVVTFATPSNTVGATTGWIMTLYADRPTYYVWACGQYVSEIDLTGGEIFVTDPTTGQLQQVQIQYDGGPLGGSLIGDPLECGTLVKANVRFANATDIRIDVELVK